MSPVCLIVLLHSCIALLPWAGRGQQCNNAFLHSCLLAFLQSCPAWASGKNAFLHVGILAFLSLGDLVLNVQDSTPGPDHLLIFG